MTKLERAIQKALIECLKLSNSESTLIIIDESNRELGYSIYKIAQRINENTVLVEVNNFDENCEPSFTLNAIMKHVAVNIIATSNHIFHSTTLKNACYNGSRILYLSNLSPDIIERCINTDFDFIIEKSRRVADLLSIGKVATLTTPAGTNITIPISRIKAFANTGMVHEAGMIAALPAGEACIPPVKTKSDGVVVIDGSLGSLGLVHEPIELIIKDGLIKRIYGGDEAHCFRKILKGCGQDARNLAELGIGTNPKAVITGKSIEDEKVLGTVHLAFGDAALEGGSYHQKCHVDAILKKPTLDIDGYLILKNGELLV